MTLLHQIETPLRRPDGTEFSPTLPVKFTKLRKQQIETAEKVVELMTSGTDIVIVQAQVGFGKTLMAEVVRQLMDWRMVYIPPHLALQRQFLNDFPYAKLLYGRGNFRHGRDPGNLYPAESCSDCHSKSLCPAVGPCDYKKAKAAFQKADVGVCNLAYFLSAASYLSMFQAGIDGTPPGIRVGLYTPLAMIDLKGNPSELDCASQHKGITLYARGDFERCMAEAWLDDNLEGISCVDCGRKGHNWMAIISTETASGQVALMACGFTCLDKLDVAPCPSEWAMIRAAGKTGEAWYGDYLTVLDEADCLKSSILGFVGTEFNMSQFYKIGEQIGCDPPMPPIKDMDSKWFDWVNEARKFVLQGSQEAGPMMPDDILGNRYRKSLARLYSSLMAVEEDWVYHPVREFSKTSRRTGDVYKVNLAPLRVGRWGRDVFWRFVKNGLITSGTILSGDQFAFETGLDQTGLTYSVLNVESKWNRFRRPIYRFRGLSVTKNDHSKPWSQQECWEELLKKLFWIIEEYPEDRKLVHTVSHDMAMELSSAVGKKIGYGRVFTHVQEHTPERREEETERFKRKHGGILFSAVATRGIDLPNDACRDVIWAKCPWANIGDKRVKMLLESRGGREEYNIDAARDYYQGIGRAMRWGGDWCRIWNLDEQLDRILQMKSIAPGYVNATIRPHDVFFTPGFPEFEEEE